MKKEKTHRKLARHFIEQLWTPGKLYQKTERGLISLYTSEARVIVNGKKVLGWPPHKPHISYLLGGERRHDWPARFNLDPGDIFLCMEPLQVFWYADEPGFDQLIHIDKTLYSIWKHVISISCRILYKEKVLGFEQLVWPAPPRSIKDMETALQEARLQLIVAARQVGS